MKSPSSYARPRRPAVPRKPVRLNLRRAGRGGDEEEVRTRRQGSFWKWVGLVALFHVLVLGVFMFLYHSTATPPPEPFISLLPEGDTTHGTPGQQAAPKLSPTTSAPSHTAAPPPVHPKTAPAPKPLPTASTKPQDLVEKPVPVKPTPPKPKVKVDLTLADGPQDNTPKIKPKPHVQKPADPTATEAASESTTSGLSREQVAAKLGAKLDAEGVKSSLKTGISGSPHSQASPFADFYASIRDQVMSKWTSPNLTDESAVNPVVQIHIDKDGRVPPELVKLVQSSGNPAYDDSALAAARDLGYLLQPLPDGCPPDTQVTFKLTR